MLHLLSAGLLVACSSGDDTGVEGTAIGYLDGSATCSDAPGPRVMGCMTVDGIDAFEPVAIIGTVEEVEHGGFPCTGINGPFETREEPGRWRFRIVDGTRTAWIGVRLPWPDPLVSVGDELSVRYEFDSRAVESGALHIEGEDGSTLLWIGIAPTTSGLKTPSNVTVRDGDECFFKDECGKHGRTAFAVQFDGTDVPVPYSEMVQVGPYVAVHVSNDHVTSNNVNTNGCTYQTYARSSIALIRGELADLSAP